MLYGPYIKSLKGWDSNRDGLPTPTTTLIGIRGPSKSRSYLDLNEYLSDPEIPSLAQVNLSVHHPWYEVLYSPMIAAVGLLIECALVRFLELRVCLFSTLMTDDMTKASSGVLLWRK